MSVQMCQYAGFGYFLDYKPAMAALEALHTEDAIEEMFDKYHMSAFKTNIIEVNGFSMVVDGMSAKFIFFGKVHQKSEVYEPLQKVLLGNASKKLKDELKAEMMSVFGTDFGMKPNSFVFTLYS